MPFIIRLTDDASGDLDDLYAHTIRDDSRANAEALLTQIEAVVKKLATAPQRGAYPQELSELGIREYREMLFKPYRIIYRTIGRSVYIYLIVDGRRDMRALLARRLLGA